MLDLYNKSLSYNADLEINIMGLECIDSNGNKRIFISSILVNILFVTFIYELLFDEKSDLKQQIFGILFF